MSNITIFVVLFMYFIFLFMRTLLYWEVKKLCKMIWVSGLVSVEKVFSVKVWDCSLILCGLILVRDVLGEKVPI